MGVSEFVVLEDDVVRLLPLSLDDASEWHAGEDDEVRGWFQFPRATVLEENVAAIERWIASWRDGGPVRHFGIWDVASGSLAGGVELRDLGSGSANVSYNVFPVHRRRGVGTRAVELACRYARDEMSLERVVAIAAVGNTASQGVALAAGFRLEGPADPSEHSETGPHLRFARTLI